VSITTVHIRGLYYKNLTIIYYDSGIVNKFGASLTDDATVIIYNHHMFITQATDLVEYLCIGLEVDFEQEAVLM
jgi:hypothetical protein